MRALHPLDNSGSETAATLIKLAATALVACAPGVVLGAFADAGISRVCRLRVSLVTAAIVLVFLTQVLVPGWPILLLLHALWPEHITGPTTSAIAVSLIAEILAGGCLRALWSLANSLDEGTLRHQLRKQADSLARSEKAMGEKTWRPILRSFRVQCREGWIDLGYAPTSGKTVGMQVSDIRQHVFVLGRTGSGKTSLLLRLLEQVSHQEPAWAVVVIDGKPGGELLQELTELHRGDAPTVVDPGHTNSASYNLAAGNWTDVSAKLVGAFTYGANAAVYQNIAQLLIVVIVKLLEGNDIPVNLEAVHAHCSVAAIMKLVGTSRFVPLELSNMLGSFQSDRLYATSASGLQARLGALLAGEYGPIFTAGPPWFSWEAAQQGMAFSYFGVGAGKVPLDSALWLKALLQDVKALIDKRVRLTGNKAPLLLCIDECAALAATSPDIEQALSDVLITGRSAGVHVVLATQYLPTSPNLLQAVASSGASAFLRSSPGDAEAVAKILGTAPAHVVTQQVQAVGISTGLGSATPGQRFKIHPNQVKTLPVGRAILASGNGRIDVCQVLPVGSVRDSLAGAVFRCLLQQLVRFKFWR